MRFFQVGLLQNMFPLESFSSMRLCCLTRGVQLFNWTWAPSVLDQILFLTFNSLVSTSNQYCLMWMEKLVWNLCSVDVYYRQYLSLGNQVLTTRPFQSQIFGWNQKPEFIKRILSLLYKFLEWLWKKKLLVVYAEVVFGGSSCYISWFFTRWQSDSLSEIF